MPDMLIGRVGDSNAAASDLHDTLLGSGVSEGIVDRVLADIARRSPSPVESLVVITLETMNGSFRVTVRRHDPG